MIISRAAPVVSRSGALLLADTQNTPGVVNRILCKLALPGFIAGRPAEAEAPPTRADTTTGTAPRAAPADDPRQGRRAASSGTGGAGRGGRRPPGAGPDAGRRPRLAESPRRRVLRARYQAYTQSINGPPIVPPGPCKPSPAILQNHRHRDRQQAAAEARGTAQQTAIHTAPAPPPASSTASTQAHSHTQHSQRQPINAPAPDSNQTRRRMNQNAPARANQNAPACA